MFDDMILIIIAVPNKFRVNQEKVKNKFKQETELSSCKRQVNRVLQIFKSGKTGERCRKNTDIYMYTRKSYKQHKNTC